MLELKDYQNKAVVALEDFFARRDIISTMSGVNSNEVALHTIRTPEQNATLQAYTKGDLENDVPFLYHEHPLDPEEVDDALRWIILQRNTAAIEEVTDAMLEDIIEDNEYVAVLFMGI